MSKACFYYYPTWILLCRFLRTMGEYAQGMRVRWTNVLRLFISYVITWQQFMNNPSQREMLSISQGEAVGAHMRKQLQRPYLKLIVGREKVDGDEWLRTKETFHVASPILSTAIWHKEWKLWVSTLNFLPVFDPRRNYKSAPPTLAASTCNSRALTPAVLSFAMVR